MAKYRIVFEGHGFSLEGSMATAEEAWLAYGFLVRLTGRRPGVSIEENGSPVGVDYLKARKRMEQTHRRSQYRCE